MRNLSGWWLIIVIMLLIDLYVFSAVKFVTLNSSERTKWITYVTYWLVSALSVTVIILLPWLMSRQDNVFLRNYAFAIVVGLFFAKLIAGVFLLTDDLRRGIVWVMSRLFGKSGADFMPGSEGITRSAFLSWLGISLGSGLFASLMYGFSNKYNYQVTRVKLAYKNLPAAFKGLKIIHISDIHSGSFTNKKEVNKGVDLILAQKPDIVLFTGDLVNDRSTEMKEYMDVFSRIKAPMGVFSTLGNHDYGDYVEWPSATAKTANLEELKQVHAQLGWRLLMNEHVELKKDNDAIALLGIENWSALGRFPKYGHMEKAYPGTEKYPFKILMSHDPSHWHAEVTTKYGDIDLMLAGHTHGMQFGVENPYFKWSPVQWVYKEWAGLYETATQKLYVNRGYGFIGYPGRVGILPEITLIELA